MSRFTTRAVLILISVFTTTFAFEPLFDSWLDYPMGSTIDAITHADFNNDGYADFACASKVLENLNIYMNNGDGTFQPPVEVYSGDRTTKIQHGDFNQDGWTDLATISDNNTDINIIMNQGDGTFIWKDRYNNYGSYFGLVVLDMNNDGFDDILVPQGTYMSVLFSNGDSTFAIENPVLASIDVAGWPQPWDVDGDDYMDLLVYGNKLTYIDEVNYILQPVIATFINNADSTFQAGKEYIYSDSTDRSVFRLATGYFNSDSELDLFVTDTQNKRTILASNGDGSFFAADSFVKDYRVEIACGDINNDGFSDLIIPDNPNAVISVMLNNGSNEISFADSINYSVRPNSNPNRLIQLFSTDVNNDHYDDIIQYEWNLSILINHRDGSFPVLTTIDDMGSGVFDILADDYNGDGFADILTIDAGKIYLKYNDGYGQFSDLQSFSCDLNDPRGIFSGDFNKDGMNDFGVTGIGGLQLYYGLEEGGFENRKELGKKLDSLSGYKGLCEDLNHDGIMDFAVLYSGSSALITLLSDTSGNFHVDFYGLNGVYFEDIAVADLDADSDMDIVVASYTAPGGPGIISIRYNDGTGQFPELTTITTEFMAMGVVLEDFNGDGYSDIAVTQYSTYDGYVSVYLNNQNGTFTDPIKYARLYAPAYRDITSADMDNDGDMDVLASIEMYDEIAVLLNDGDGTFPDIHYYPGGDNIKAFVIAYLDVDSTMDLAVASSAPAYEPYRDYVYLFLNTGLDLLPTSLSEKTSKSIFPEGITLFQNFPNPFNPETIIRYILGAQGHEPQHVDLSVYNLLGQKMATLVSERQPAGTYQVEWDASGFASGVYYYQIRTDHGFVQTKKLMFLK